MIVVMMGPAGAGKTTVGRQLARAIGWRFVEGDDFHPAANVRAMRAGRPLTEAQREPWLAALAGELRGLLAAGESAVVACSALKRAHRRALLPPGADAPVRFVYLRAAPGMLRRRLAGRAGHFFPAELADSQLDALEEPDPDEGVLILEADLTPDELVAEIRAALTG